MAAPLRSVLTALLLLVLALASSAMAQSTLCPGSVVALDVSSGWSPFVSMRLGRHEGKFQVDTGSTYSTVDAKIFEAAAGTVLTLDGSSFPTISGGQFRVLSFDALPAPGGRQAGQIGTDFLGRRTAEFHYEATPPYLVVSEQPCSDRALEAAGFVAISQHGYYGAAARADRAGGQNLPVIFIRIGTVAAPAWIDTGLKEIGRNGIVQINEPLLRELRATGLDLTAAGFETFTNCLGERFGTPLWRVKTAPLLFTAEDGRELFAYDPPLLQVVPVNSCGGPGNISMPLARVGAVYLHWWRALVLDSLNERVWVSPTLAQPPERHRAMAFAWNDTGAWVVRLAPSRERAGAQALADCNEKYGNCHLSTAGIEPSAALCLALARNQRNRRELSWSTAGSLDDVRRNVLDYCAKAKGGVCEIEYSGCND
jgi:hypothetical protein